jgi:muconolactone delta-isomerase
MRASALRAIDAHSQTTVTIGDRMDTDLVDGIPATGSARSSDLNRRPTSAA